MPETWESDEEWFHSLVQVFGEGILSENYVESVALGESKQLLLDAIVKFRAHKSARQYGH